MTGTRLVLRGLRFYWRTHLGVLVGCAISAAVLVGALAVGDSARGSLQRIAQARLGRIDVALETGNRHFRDDLAGRLGLQGRSPAALHLRGMALRDEGGGRWKQVNRVEALGVAPGFLSLATSPAALDLGERDVALNEKLAAALGAKVGDEVALRVPRPSLFSRDAPLASQKGTSERRDFTVRAILTDAQLGRFSLKSDQAEPYNAFVELHALQKLIGMEGRANVLVGGPASAEEAQAALAAAWKLEDAGLVLRNVERHGVSQLQSPRIYLDPAVAEKALGALPDSVGALSYLVNSITSEQGKSTPYSFVTALSPSSDRRLGVVPAGMKDDEILVNRWLADETGVKPGDRVKVAYSELTAGETFVARERSFTVRAVLEMDALSMEKELVPEFPGLTDVESCKEWEVTRLPMEKQALENKPNEKYWKDFRQTPKAFVTLAAGREMWANRFGDLMAVRYAAGTVSAETLRARIDPAETGLAFRPVAQLAARAVSESMDLGPLFLGMSLFLVVASLTLTALLFVFSVEQRAREMGTLLAVGYPPGRVKGLLLAEGGALALLGSLAGIPLGAAFAKLLLWGLATAWSGAVANAPIGFHVEAGSAAIGALAAAALSLLAMGVALWRLSGRPVRQLVAEDFQAAGGRPRVALAVFLVALALSAGILVTGAGHPAAAFFAAGALLLVGMLALVRAILSRLSAASSSRLFLSDLGLRNASRRPGRSLAAAGMLACGTFIVFAVAAMKQDLSLEAGRRLSGTGGFELYGESSVAFHHDLNGEKGRAEYRLSDGELEGVSIVPIKMREGDDASCLNLNQSLTPPLLGVDPATFSRLGAFAGPETWNRLEEAQADGAVPAIVGDSATAMWKLKKRVAPKDGETLDYADERGRPFRVRLVGALPTRLSVFQGRLLIANRDFTRLFPSESGQRVFVADVPSGREESVAAHLTQRLESAGIDWVPAVARLKEFYVVESTYLAMFLALGGMGVLLGSAGMGVLVLRSVMERRGELALLRAVGYSDRQARGVVMSEHRFLVMAGLGTGIAAAALAIAPAVTRPGVHVPYALLIGFLAGTALLSLAWIRIAAGLALRGALVPSLRNE